MKMKIELKGFLDKTFLKTLQGRILIRARFFMPNDIGALVRVDLVDLYETFHHNPYKLTRITFHMPYPFRDSMLSVDPLKIEHLLPDQIGKVVDDWRDYCNEWVCQKQFVGINELTSSKNEKDVDVANPFMLQTLTALSGMIYFERFRTFDDKRLTHVMGRLTTFVNEQNSTFRQIGIKPIFNL